MPESVRWLIVVTLVLLVPIIPFVLWGDALDARIERWFDDALSPPATAALIAGVLASDVLLPVPSSLVSTLAGARLGILGGTIVVWFGMTVGAMLGFALARWFGRAVAHRISTAADLERMELLVEKRGPIIIALTRPLPVLAEASVLMAGTMGLSWRSFLPVVILANLGIAAAYAALGYYAGQEGNLAVALGASVALPILATMVARWLLPAERQTS